MANLIIDPKTVESKLPLSNQTDLIPPPNSIPLIHVFNPFHNSKPSSFSPLDSEQWSMLASTRRAKENFIQHQLEQSDEHPIRHAFDQIIIACAIMDTDAEALAAVLPVYCDQIVHLERSTATQYPELQLKPLPFVQDIINAGRNVAHDVVQENEYYLMMTNSDICLTEHFYTHLNEHEIPSKEAKALTINRMTIPDIIVPTISEGAPPEVVHVGAMDILDQAKEVYESNQFKYHPGVDCFVAHSSIWEMIQFGDMFLGFPPFDWHIKLAFEIMAPSYQDVKSNTQGTFHLRDDRAWANAKKESLAPQFGPEDVVLEKMKQCPRFFNPATERHAVQNGINCGEMFYTPVPREVPNFVRPGYEDVYKEAFARRHKPLGDYKNAFPPCLRGPRNPHRCVTPAHYLGGGRGNVRRGPWANRQNGNPRQIYNPLRPAVRADENQ